MESERERDGERKRESERRTVHKLRSRILQVGIVPDIGWVFPAELQRQYPQTKQNSLSASAREGRREKKSVGEEGG